MPATIATPSDYNVKLYLVAACVYAALQAADRLPPSAGQQPGTPKAAVVAGAAGGRSLLLGLPAGVGHAPAGDGGNGGGRAECFINPTVSRKSRRGAVSNRTATRATEITAHEEPAAG